MVKHHSRDTGDHVYNSGFLILLLLYYLFIYLFILKGNVRHSLKVPIFVDRTFPKLQLSSQLWISYELNNSGEREKSLHGHTFHDSLKFTEVRHSCHIFVSLGIDVRPIDTMITPTEFGNEKSQTCVLLQSFSFNTGGHSLTAVVSNAIFGDATHFRYIFSNIVV